MNHKDLLASGMGGLQFCLFLRLLQLTLMASKGMAKVTVVELPGMKEEFKEASVAIQIADIMSTIARLDGAPQATTIYIRAVTIDIFRHQLRARLAVHPLSFRSVGPIAPRK